MERVLDVVIYKVVLLVFLVYRFFFSSCKRGLNACQVLYQGMLYYLKMQSVDFPAWNESVV